MHVSVFENEHCRWVLLPFLALAICALLVSPQRGLTPSLNRASAPLLSSCAQISQDEVRDAVAGAVNSRIAQRVGANGPPFTISAIENVHPCIRNVDKYWSPLHEVLFIVMGSSVMLERSAAVRATWAKNVDNVLIFGDVNDAKVEMQTLPELAGKNNYFDAQHRQLHGLVYALQNSTLAQLPWVLLVDDDSWVNIRELPSFLHGWNPDAPLLFAFIATQVANEPNRVWPAGGAGMLLTREAARRLSEALYTPACPFEHFNDMTIGRCAWAIGIALVHSPLFVPEAETIFNSITAYGKMRSEVSIHRVTPARMAELQAMVDQFPENAI